MTFEEFKKEFNLPKVWSLKIFSLTLLVGFCFGFMVCWVILNFC